MPGVTLALFIVGLLFVRHGVFERALEHRRVLGGLIAFGLVSWTADNWLLPASSERFVPSPVFLRP